MYLSYIDYFIYLIYMTFNFKKGKMVALIKSNKNKNDQILLVDDKNKDGYKVVKLDDNNSFIPVLDSDTRSITYICGASGSGKSTLANSIIENFNIMFPDSNIYIFSRLKTDPAFNKLEKIIIRIPIDESLVDDPIDVINDIEEWSLVLFDDIDTISDKKIMDALNNIKSQILEIGRHKNIYCIVTSHLISGSNRAATRTMMNEMTNLVIFPKGGGSVYQQRYTLKNYLGFNNKEVDKIINADDTRWVLICKNYPQYILTQKICYLV